MENKHGIYIFILWINFFLPLFGQSLIEKIEIKGNQRISEETILYYFNLFPQQSYNEEDLEQGLKALWSVGFFSDIKVALSKREKGHVIILSVKEYPVIQEIVFKTEGKLKEREILDVLNKKNIKLPKYSVYDPQNMLKIRTVIKEILEERGFNQGSIESKIKDIGKSEAEVVFHIQEGPRFRIDKIIFLGETKLAKSFLLNAFEFNHVHNIVSWFQGKDIFRKAKLDEDLENLRNTYHEYGYADAWIGDPLIEDCIKPVLFGSREPMKRIIVPVAPGDIYRVGEINIKKTGNFPIPQIQHQILLETGEIYNGKILDRAVEEIKTLYRNRGYFYVQVLSSQILDHSRGRIDINFDIQAGNEVYLRRLYISGNNLTDDRIIRKVMWPLEQAKFRLDRFLKSLKKLGFMGIVRLADQPKIVNSTNNHDLIDIHLEVDEVHKNEWQLSGGYSRYQGIYLGGFVSVVDFFGQGEKVNLMIDHGVRYKNYKLGLFKPYLFDRFFSVGFTLFDRDVVYPDLFVRKGRGLNLRADIQVKENWWAALSYKLETVNADLSDSNKEENVEHDLGSIKFFFYRNTMDDAFFPSNGMKFLFSLEYAGSALGSYVHYVKPELDGTVFFPLVKNHSLAFHMAFRSIRPLDGSVIPSWEKFYLGGERTIRGYDVYSIGPKGQEGKNIGGEKTLVLNAEYIVPVFKSMAAVLFIDTGSALKRIENFSLGNLYWSSGLELRMKILNFSVPLRLIFAYKHRLIEKKDSHLTLRFAFGVSF